MTATSNALNVGELLTAARDKTGLHEFGDDWFHEPLSVLVSALNNEARLSETGLELTRRRLTALLVDRLRLRALQRGHPEISEVRPLLAAEICGLPRTGSTLLHRLLSASPKLTSTLSWETSYPIPFPGEGPDAAERKRRAQQKMRLFLEYSPDFGDIHTIEWDGPEEDVLILDRTFTSMSFESFYRVPSYGDWLRRADQSRAYDELRQWLQVLQWQQPTRANQRWVLKSPHHLMATGTVLDTFPECRIVMTHRSPTRAVPSYASMVRSIASQYSDEVAPDTLGPYWSERFVSALRDFTRVRTQRPDRFVDVHYTDMLSEPSEEAHRVLDELGLAPDDTDDSAFTAHLRADGEQPRAAHSYTPEEYGLTDRGLERDFAFYTATFPDRS